MVFVKSIEEDLPVNQNTDQFEILKKIFATTPPNSFFCNIKNPIEWQKEIRDEWETL
jgi:hypothetical protein